MQALWLVATERISCDRGKEMSNSGNWILGTFPTRIIKQAWVLSSNILVVAAPTPPAVVTTTGPYRPADRLRY
ncbi:hypothetical protein DIJ64_10790 [Mycobacterium leprae]|uniref:Uncharacterized protein n=1 Tax=Mycobacterium leprae TaxID=1769 RepID=A0AAD0KTD6_MYCLR|nr:hypothetical protein DIJ64_10790 [Mycobacterium leprae]